MRFLIDTHALLWYFEGNSSLSSQARAAMEDQRAERFVSHATAWEIAIKLNLGKLELKFDFGELFVQGIAANGFQMLPSDVRDYTALIGLPHHHRDPFDRLLIAQAQVNQLTIVTRDPVFTAYGVPTLW